MVKSETVGCVNNCRVVRRAGCFLEESLLGFESSQVGLITPRYFGVVDFQTDFQQGVNGLPVRHSLSERCLAVQLRMVRAEFSCGL